MKIIATLDLPVSNLLLCEVLGHAAGAGLLVVVHLLRASLPLPSALTVHLFLLAKAHLLHDVEHLEMVVN